MYKHSPKIASIIDARKHEVWGIHFGMLDCTNYAFPLSVKSEQTTDIVIKKLVSNYIAHLRPLTRVYDVVIMAVPPPGIDFVHPSYHINREILALMVAKYNANLKWNAKKYSLRYLNPWSHIGCHKKDLLDKKFFDKAGILRPDFASPLLDDALREKAL